MPKPPVVFLDDGGVLNENPPRAHQWERLIGEFFAPRYGRDAAAWGEANRVVFPAVNARLDELAALPWAEYLRAYNRLWLLPMFEHLGLPPPPDDRIDPLVTQAFAWVTRRVHSAIPGAAETVRWLRANDYRLFTASGEDSVTLDGYLTAMGVRDCFGDRVYGPDLVDFTKSGPTFHERVFADAGVDPADALVIDDSPKPVAWARGLGARALHVGTELGSLADLPAWLTDQAR